MNWESAERLPKTKWISRNGIKSLIKRFYEHIIFIFHEKSINSLSLMKG